MKSDKLLYSGAKELGIDLENEQVQNFIIYLDLLKEWNKKINLTSIEDEKDIIIKHFLDSLSVSSLLNLNSRMLDIGSGGGFPGLPLAIAHKGFSVTLLDSIEKKVVFMREVIRKLKLINIEAVWGRAEDKNNKIKRNSFGIVITRAVGEIDRVLEYSFPYLEEKGEIILMRGKDRDKDWQSAVNRFAKDKNCSLTVRIIDLKIPFSDYKRYVVKVSK